MVTVIGVLAGALLIALLLGVSWGLVFAWHTADRRPVMRAVVFFGGLSLVSLLVALAPALYYVLFLLIAQLVG